MLPGYHIHQADTREITEPPNTTLFYGSLVLRSCPYFDMDGVEGRSYSRIHVYYNHTNYNRLWACLKWRVNHMAGLGTLTLRMRDQPSTTKTHDHGSATMGKKYHISKGTDSVNLVFCYTKCADALADSCVWNSYSSTIQKIKSI